MNTNTESLRKAATFWQSQLAVAIHAGTYVVVSADDRHVLADNTAMMLAGCCTPYTFYLIATAQKAAERVCAGGWDFDAVELRVMTYANFCRNQQARFEAAIQAARVADAMTRQPVAA